MIYSKEDVIKLGTILCVWAHPDDESYTSAGLLSAAIENGQRVVVVTATKGSAGVSSDEQKWPTHKLGEIRFNELKKALDIMGVDEMHCLNLRDGELNVCNQEDAIDKLELIIREVDPDTVITFGKDGMTGHLDHKTVHAWTVLALNEIGNGSKLLCAIESQEFYENTGKKLDQKFNIYYGSDKELVSRENADICFMLKGDIFEKKKNCLKCHESQMGRMFADSDGISALNELCQFECFMYENL